MPKDVERLIQMAEEHEEKARAFRLAAAALNGHHTEKAKATIDKKLKHASHVRTEQRPDQWKSMNRLQLKSEREDLVRAYLSVTPEGASVKETESHLVGLGFPKTDVMTIRNAIIAVGAKRIGKGNATRWMFNGKAPKFGKKGYWDGDAVKERRERTKALLDKAAAADAPLPAAFFGGKGVGALLHAGYLKKQADGFVRTSKEFVV